MQKDETHFVRVSSFFKALFVNIVAIRLNVKKLEWIAAEGT